MVNRGRGRLQREDVTPCRHDAVIGQVREVKNLITDLATIAPDLLQRRGIANQDYQMLLRAAVESLRGTAAASTTEKRRFIDAILNYGHERGVFRSWRFEGTENRQDYRVELNDGILVAIEAKGCPDGNNTTIWDRPGWANEFVVWCLCPDGLIHQPGEGVWSGIATRLLPKLAAEGTEAIVDAMLFWDARCGSALRRCPKNFGVNSGLRARATNVPGQDERDWLPPPCIYLFPSAPPQVRNNPSPRVHTIDTCRFANCLLELFNVPEAERASYTHAASVQARGTNTGMQIQVTVTSRCWPDGLDRNVSGEWKPVRRE